MRAGRWTVPEIVTVCGSTARSGWHRALVQTAGPLLNATRSAHESWSTWLSRRFCCSLVIVLRW